MNAIWIERRHEQRAMRVLRAILLVIFTTAVSSTAYAQGSAAAVTGVVRDQLGGELPGVKVMLTPSGDHARQESEALTGQDGSFTFRTVPPGDYVLQASLPGTQPVHQNFTLGDRQQVNREITIRLLAIAERVTAMHAIAEEARREPVNSNLGAGGCLDPGSTDCLEAPGFVVRIAPLYPAEVGTAKGAAVLGGRIAGNGSLAALHVLSSDRSEFARAAIAAVSRWKFRPTRLNGKPIDTVITVTAEFGTER